MPTAGEQLLIYSSLSSPNQARDHFQNISTGSGNTYVGGELEIDLGLGQELTLDNELEMNLNTFSSLDIDNDLEITINNTEMEIC